MYYTIQPTSKDILHYGKGHDDSPPGRGSGRYAWGSGKNVKKLQNSDGSLTKRGKEKFYKLIDIKKKNDELIKKARQAADEEHKYVKKSGYLKGNGENYKVAAQYLYMDDPNFRPIADATIDAWKEQRAVGEQYIKEIRNVAKRNYDLFTVIGYDRVQQILKDYEEYEINNVKKEIDSNGGYLIQDLNKSSTFNKSFLDHIKSDISKPEMVDDLELMELLKMEYEADTGKSALSKDYVKDLQKKYG